MGGAQRDWRARSRFTRHERVMRGVRISSLGIAAFRGISEPVRFDLSAPLTLVFAPNGTGKTTMCEAAEWLLTGQVERLKDGKIFDAHVLRSKFSMEGQTPTVEAGLFVAGKHGFLTRVAEGMQSPASWGETNDAATRLGPHELLSLLAPAAAADEAHHLTAINLRQRWLKGTRFLSAEALAALVDTDVETIERRTQVFADLLGIRHLLDAERQCEKYANEMGARLRTLSQLIDQQRSEALELEGALASEELPADANVSARSEAAAAAKMLNMDDSADLESSNLVNRLEALTAVHRRQRHAFDERSRAAERVEAQWSARRLLETAVLDNTNLEAKLAAALAEIEEKGSAAGALVSQHMLEREVADEAARTLANAKDRLTYLASALLTALLDAQLLADAPQSLAMLDEQIAEARWTVAARRDRRRELAALKASMEHAVSEDRRLRLINVEITQRESDRISETELAVLRNDAINADALARAARSALDATAEPVARLQSAARDFLVHDHGGLTLCPVCAHKWQDPGALRAAIATALAFAPDVTQSARIAAELASETARVARARLDGALSAYTAIDTLEKERAALVASVEQRTREIVRLGLASDEPLAAISAAENRLDVADALAELVAACDALTPTLPGGPAPLLPRETVVLSLLDRLTESFLAREQHVQLQLAELAKAIETSIAARDELRAGHAGTQQRLRECREGLRDKATELAILRAAWESAAPQTEWSDSALAQLKAELAAESRCLQSAEAHIEAARAAWASEARCQRLEALKRALAPLLEHQKRMTDRIAAAHRARAEFQEAYATISRKRVQDLSHVVNSLFARMHANRVFDRINLGQDSNFLHWLADAGSEQLDPGTDFSQGQRQDLALSLFLARARSLGGTFFLDEPVIHLDDLNRVGLLDSLRAIVLDSSRLLNLVITTSSRALARHLIEKFAGIGPVETPAGFLHPLRVLELDGNGRSGVSMRTIYPLR